MGVQMFRKKSRAPNPENWPQKVVIYSVRGNPSRSFPKIGFFSKTFFFQDVNCPSSEGGDQLGAGPIHGLNHPSSSKQK